MDRLGWAVGYAAVCYGVRVGLRTTAKEGRAVLKAWLPRAAKPSPSKVVDRLYSFILGGPGPRSGVRRFHVLYGDAELLIRSLDLEAVRRAFERDLSMTIGQTARRRIFVHAGVVGIGGRAILIPGRSFSGKTTLTKALVDQGGVYYSDEYAVLDSRGHVSPWAEPLSIRRNGPLTYGDPHSPESLGLVPGKGSLPVSMVVLTSFEGARRFRPRPVTASAGALGLLEHVLPARTRPRASMRAVAAAVSGARVIRGPRGDAGDAARIILRMLEVR